MRSLFPMTSRISRFHSQRLSRDAAFSELPLSRGIGTASLFMFIAFYSTVLQLRRYNTFMWLRNINMPRAAALSPEGGTLGFCVVHSKLTTANVRFSLRIYLQRFAFRARRIDIRTLGWVFSLTKLKTCRTPKNMSILIQPIKLQKQCSVKPRLLITNVYVLRE